MSDQLYVKFARTLQALKNCERTNNHEWAKKHLTNIQFWTKDFLPSGSGFDNGTHFNFEKSTPDKLVFDTAFHHMNDGGYYDGWSEHQVIVTANLAHGFNLKVTGRDRNDIKDYIGSVFYDCMRNEKGYD